eukprot:GHVH01010773.1.p1 GENE.GHVH01010773.1~~GHVH01010773.1.p1  ORF type:complete len:537 (-),score=67.87 GHVH01010773.1:1015-2625(-)
MPVQIPSNLVISNPRDEEPVKNLVVHLENVGKPFNAINRSAKRLQYATHYCSRLRYLRPFLQHTAKLKWNNCRIMTLIEMMKADKTDKDIVVLGVLHKQMRLKPSVLSEYTKALDVSFPDNSVGYVQDEDYAFLEEEGGRLELIWEIEGHEKDTDELLFGARGGDSARSILGRLVTGLAVAVRGELLDGGQFRVVDILLPGDWMHAEMVDLTMSPVRGKGPLVALVSNLRVADPKISLSRVKKLSDWIASRSQLAFGDRVSRLIVVGNAVGKLESPGNPLAKSGNTLKFVSADVDDNATTSLQEVDVYFDSLASMVPVDLVSGSEDPTTFALPQSSLAPRLFPVARQRSSFQCLSNPALVDLSLCTREEDNYSTRVLIASSQPIEDILRFTDFESSLQALVLCIRGQLIAPTCPDTLSTVPSEANDLFCIPSPCCSAKKDKSLWSQPCADEVELCKLIRQEYDDRFDEIEIDTLEKFRSCYPDLIVTGGHEKSSAVVFKSESMSVLGLCIGDFHATGDVVLFNPMTKTVEGIVEIE